MGLLQFSEKWLAIDFMNIAADILNELDDYIADLNRQQLSDGLRADNGDINPPYTNFTKNIKSNKSGLSGVIEHVTLYDTGDFHKSILTNIISGSIVLDATDGKADELVGKYGNIIGLNDDSIKKLQIKFRPIFIERIEKLLP